MISSKSSSSMTTLIDRPICPSLGARCILRGADRGSGLFLPVCPWSYGITVLGCNEPAGGMRSGISAMPYMSSCCCTSLGVFIKNNRKSLVGNTLPRRRQNVPKLILKQCLQHLGRVKHGEIKPSTFYVLNNETQ